MRVFSVPVSAPFLRTVIAALVDGRLVDGFEARAHPGKPGAGDALSADPARRTHGAGNLSRRVEDRRGGAAAHRRPRRHRRRRTRLRGRGRAIWRRGAVGYSAEARRTRAPADAGEAGRGLGQGSGAGAAGGRRPGIDAGAGRRSGAADGRHGDPRRRLGRARRAGAGPARPILAALARIPADRAKGVAGASQRNRQDRAGGAARSADRGGSRAPDRASRRPGDRGRLDRFDAGDGEIPPRRCHPAARRGGAAGARHRSRRGGVAADRRRQGRARQIHHASGIEPSAIRDARAAGQIRHQARATSKSSANRRRTGAMCWSPRRCGHRTQRRSGIGGWPSPRSSRRFRAA